MQIKRGIFHRLLSLRLLRDTQMMAVNNIFFFILIAPAMRWHDKEFENGKSEKKRKKSSKSFLSQRFFFASNAKLLLTQLKKPFVESNPNSEGPITWHDCKLWCGRNSIFFQWKCSRHRISIFYSLSRVLMWCDDVEHQQECTPVNNVSSI